MTISDPRYAFPALAQTKLVEADDEKRDGVPVGTGDVAADKLNSGADPDAVGRPVPRDSDGVPVGRDDVAEDIRRSGGDPDRR